MSEVTAFSQLFILDIPLNIFIPYFSYFVKYNPVVELQDVLLNYSLNGTNPNILFWK